MKVPIFLQKIYKFPDWNIRHFIIKHVTYLLIYVILDFGNCTNWIFLLRQFEDGFAKKFLFIIKMEPRHDQFTFLLIALWPININININVKMKTCLSPFFLIMKKRIFFFYFLRFFFKKVVFGFLTPLIFANIK